MSTFRASERPWLTPKNTVPRAAEVPVATTPYTGKPPLARWRAGLDVRCAGGRP